MATDENIATDRGGVIARLDREDLDERGDAVRFEYGDSFGNTAQGVALRIDGGIVAFRNDCPHLGLRLDGQSGTFLDEAEEELVCDHHGARFELGRGRCREGPCEGDRLEWFRVESDAASGEVVVRKGRSLSI